jgi:hypothetical protein
MPVLSPEEEMSQAVEVSNNFWNQLDELVREATVLSEVGIPAQEQLRELQRKLEALRDCGGTNDCEDEPWSGTGRILQTDVPLVERILPIIDLRLNGRSKSLH